MAEKCTLCTYKFKEDENIVVCETCGSKYHDSCWNRMVQCDKCGACTPLGTRVAEKQRQVEIQAQEEDTKKQETQANFSAGVHYVKDNINNKLNNEETGMFANIGEKIKAWAKAITVIGIISGIITVIATLIIDESMLLAGVVAGVIEVVSAWSMALILYAFGELVANSKESKNIQQQILDELRSKDQNKEQ